MAGASASDRAEIASGKGSARDKREANQGRAIKGRGKYRRSSGGGTPKRRVTPKARTGR